MDQTVDSHKKARPLWPWVVAAVVVLLAAVAFSFWWPMHQAKNVFAEIESRGGSIDFKTDRPRWAGFLDEEMYHPWFDRVISIMASEPVDDSFLQEISVFRELEDLGLDVSNASSEEIREISQFKQLEFLQLDGGGKSIPIGWISSLSNLEYLILFDLSASHADWQRIAEARLPIIFLSFSQLSLDEMQREFCGSLSSLSRLEVRECKYSAAFWDGLSKNRSVRHLRLHSLDIDERSMEALCRLSSLKVVVGEDVDLNSNQIRQLSLLKNLDYLWLERCQLPDDESWEALSTLLKLENVDLRGTSVGDACASALSKCSPIRDLDLSGTSLTDAGLEQLQRLPGLEVLDVRHSNVTPDGFRKFRKSRPDVEISPSPRQRARQIEKEGLDESE